MSKGYVEDLFDLLNKLKNKENFAFTRFSDGEVFVMQNKNLLLATDRVEVGETTYNFGYSEDDYKEFIPEKHGFVREKLLEAFSYKKKNYFVGGGCADCTCAIREYGEWLQNLYHNGSEHWMSPNLFVNSNYPLFINHFIPEFDNHQVVMVCSQKADVSALPFEVVKDFRVGTNCIVNDHHLFDEIKEYISANGIADHVFLFSASSLSEILIHQLYEYDDQNTYIDIGTTLHSYMKLGIERDYLKAYWLGQPLGDIFKSCV